MMTSQTHEIDSLIEAPLAGETMQSAAPAGAGPRFTSAGTIPPVMNTAEPTQAASASDRAFDDAPTGLRANRDLVEIRQRLMAKLDKDGCRDASDETAQAELVGETETSRMFIQHVYIRNYERGGLTEVFPQNVLTAPTEDGKQNVVGVCVHWQRENPQVPGTWYENGNQAVVAPPVGARNDITRISGEHRELFVVTQDAGTAAPQFALKSHDGGGYIGKPEGALSLYSSEEHKQTVEGERQAAKDSKDSALAERREASLAAEIAALSGPSAIVVRENANGELVVDSSVEVEKWHPVRVINATGRRIDVRTSQLDQSTLAAKRWMSPDKAVVDHGEYIVQAGGHLNIEGHHVKAQAKQ